MKKQKDRHLDAPGEANRDKHINFLAEEMGDADPADENVGNNSNEKNAADVDNGFFTKDEENAKTKSSAKHQHASISSEKIIPVPADEAQVINDSVPEGDNNNTPARGNQSKVSKRGDDDQAH